MKTKIILVGAMLTSLLVHAQVSVGVGAPGGGFQEPTPEQKAQWARDAVNAIKQQQEQKVKFLHGNVLRKVNGKIYNAGAWNFFTGKVFSKENDVLILQNDVFSETRGPNFQTIQSVHTVYTAITNYSGQAGSPVDNDSISVLAMRADTYDMGGRPIALLDCGTPYTPPPPTPEQIKAAQEAAQIAAQRQKEKQFLIESNAVHWLQPQATNGDVGAQCSLGEHLLNGQGCQTNRTLAIYWLTQAANQGDIEASNKLANLKE